MYTLFPFFPKEMVYTIAVLSRKCKHHSFFLLCDLGVGRQTKREGVPRWWCILFFLERGGKGYQKLVRSLSRLYGHFAPLIGPLRGSKGQVSRLYGV